MDTPVIGVKMPIVNHVSYKMKGDQPNNAVQLVGFVKNGEDSKETIEDRLGNKYGATDGYDNRAFNTTEAENFVYVGKSNFFSPFLRYATPASSSLCGKKR